MKIGYFKTCLLNAGGFVNGSKNDLAVVRDDVSMRLDRNIPNSKSEPPNNAERKRATKSKKFTSDVWYERAALSMKISRKAPQR
jgi:hypothetical protein